MKNYFAGWLVLAWAALLCLAPPAGLAQTTTASNEKDACIRNLKIINDAIQAYQADHKDVPNWLSDLVPQYLPDASVLICPVCKRTGQVEAAPLADPKLPCSYRYQFCPVPLGKGQAPGDPTKTRRDWKRQQMGLVGSIVPIVRCLHHTPVLNLSFDGRIYESTLVWEDLMSNRVNVADLKSTRMYAIAPPTGAASSPAPSAFPYPPRDPQARPGMINLSAYYNASLAELWHDLSSLPTGVQNFNGVEYDVRGMVQLGCKASAAKRFPERINGIKIHQKCSRLIFLHASGFGSVTNEGERVGSYILHYTANQMQLEIPIIYGRDVRDWHAGARENLSPDLTVAWTGTNGASAARLFATTWVNVAPGVEIESIDFVSAMGNAAPFLVAITAE